MIIYDIEALEYIAKVADGGMRDAITLMDKCLSYNSELTVDNVIAALGVADYATMFNLNNAIFDKDIPGVIEIISEVYNSGMDLKLFVKTYFEFILDANIYFATKDLGTTKIPSNWKDELDEYGSPEVTICKQLMAMLVDLSSSIKWEQNPKAYVIAKLVLFTEEHK